MNTTVASTLQLLRFHFSFFLMPVYFFALSQLVHINLIKAGLIFFILHLLVYPASNGYNSYMDRDNTPVGGIECPMQPTRMLFICTIVMDVSAILISIYVSFYFAIGIIIYIVASRAYSYRGIRIKQYPILGYLLVITCQGALIFYLTYSGSSNGATDISLFPILSAALLIGGFYPLTQIYQHQSDKADGVKTISMLLGYRGTFIFTGIVYALSFIMLAFTFFNNLEIRQFIILQIIMLPVMIYYFYWLIKVWRNTAEANYKNTMRMNLVASVFTNIAFIVVLMINQFE